MVDVIELIPSQDMQRALREEGRRFTDMEKASLIHNLHLPSERRRELLQELAAETKDARLRAQIEYALEKEQRQLDWFSNVTEGYVFGVQLHDEEEPGDDPVAAYFATFATAFKFGRAQGCPFGICKWSVAHEVPQTDEWAMSGERGSIEFDADGRLESAWLWETGAGESLEGGRFAPWPVGGEHERWPNFLFFEDRWVDLPNLYRLGDFVRVLDDQAGYGQQIHDWAMVEVDTVRWEEFRQRANAWLADVEAGRIPDDRVLADFSDMQVTVELPCKDGTFVHAHVNPMFLERWTKKPEADDDAELMQMAQWIAQGECSLDHASRVFKERFEASDRATSAAGKRTDRTEAPTLGEIRPLLSSVARCSVCMRETLEYENFLFMSDVPEAYDEFLVCGIGLVETEFYEGEDRYDSWEKGVPMNDRTPERPDLRFRPAIELMLSQQPLAS